MTNEELLKKITELEATVRELKKRFDDSIILQDDFGGKQIIKREVQFLGKVKNRAGTTVINN